MTMDDLEKVFNQGFWNARDGRRHRAGVKAVVEALRPTMIGLVRDGYAKLDEDFCVDHAIKKILGDEVKP